MSDPKSKFDEWLSERQPQIDELRVKLHLAKKEAQEEFAKWEAKVNEYKAKYDEHGEDAGEIFEEKAKKIGAELKDGLERLRKLFQES